MIAPVSIKNVLYSNLKSDIVTCTGWVRNKRMSKQVAFIALNDGSTLEHLQLVFDLQEIDSELISSIGLGAALEVSGKVQASQGKGQSKELQVQSVTIVGNSDSENYPLQPKKHSFEFLRKIGHLRLRTQTMSAVFRIRHKLSMAIHEFFDKEGFFYLHTPIVTALDAEGAGDLFQVTTLQNTSSKNKEDYSQDFFGKKASLSVSGQLEAEIGALALGKVYTFGPTFRAEKSNTTRHLAEFWMIEPEMAFAELKDNVQLAQQLLTYCIGQILTHCASDLAFLNAHYDKQNQQKPKHKRSSMGLIERLEFVTQNEYEVITYTKAIEILRNSPAFKKKKFEFPVEWSKDLQSEHERYLVEKHYNAPIVVTDYPKEIKAFYMKQNEDGKTVAAMDILFPGIGEVVGGSEREANHDKLQDRMTQMNIQQEDLQWYLDLRKFGSTPHSGFGLGLERLLQFITGMENIRDVIAFPRSPQDIDF